MRILFFASLYLALLSVVSGGQTTNTTTALNNMETCSQQSDCITFNMTKIPSSLCNSSCEYRVCLTLTYGGTCLKEGTISDTCVKDDTVCSYPTGFKKAAQVDDTAADGYVQCQTIAVNETAEFLLKDGAGCASSTLLSKEFGSSHVAYCTPRPSTTDSCNGLAAGEQCLWTVQAPTSCGNTGGGGGDPHIKLWNETRYPFHGECDMVLLHNDAFHGGTGIDIHVRTKIEQFWSYIETAVIRIGKDVLEISKGGQHFWLNGVEGSDDSLPDILHEFTISAPYVEPGSKAVTYRIDLNNGDYIKIRAYKKFISLDVFGLPGDFEHSIGLLGHYHNGDMLARDGSTIIEDPDDMGMEWQVRPSEPQLFREVREPVYPAKCVMPSPEQVTNRRKMRADSRMLRVAENACAHKNKHDFEFCVFDVMATGDVDMANAW